MQRREFLGKMIGTSLAVLSLDGILEGEETGSKKACQRVSSLNYSKPPEDRRLYHG